MGFFFQHRYAFSRELNGFVLYQNHLRINVRGDHDDNADGAEMANIAHSLLLYLTGYLKRCTRSFFPLHGDDIRLTQGFHMAMVAIYVERRYACWCTKASAHLELRYSGALRLAPAVATCRLTLNPQLFVACRWCRVSHVVSCHGRVQYLTADNLISGYICRPPPFLT